MHFMFSEDTGEFCYAKRTESDYKNCFFAL